MTVGTFFAVVGASGVGKDTLLNGAKGKLNGNTSFVFPKRYITRPANAGGEDHFALSKSEFQQMQDNGEFCLSWSAHQLHYGLSRDLIAILQGGCHLVCNVSRTSVDDASSVFERLQIIEITADRATRAERLKLRGRESAGDIHARQTREISDWHKGQKVHPICNDGTAQEAIAAMTDLLLSLSAQNVQST